MANNRALELLSAVREPSIHEELTRVMTGAPSAVVEEARVMDSSGIWYFVLNPASA